MTYNEFKLRIESSPESSNLSKITTELIKLTKEQIYYLMFDIKENNIKDFTCSIILSRLDSDNYKYNDVLLFIESNSGKKLEYINNNNTNISDININLSDINNNNTISLCTYTTPENETPETITTNYFEEISEELFKSNFPTIRTSNIIKIPSKIERVLTYIVPKHYFTEIDKDFEVAKELVMLVINRLVIVNVEDKDKWFTLSQNQISMMLFGKINKRTIKKVKAIFSLLHYETKNGIIVECDINYIPMKKSFGYRLSDPYKLKGIVKYELKTDKVKTLYRQHQYVLLKKINNNVIVENLYGMYSKIELPTEQTIIEHAKILIKNKFTTKKGKVLKFRNKKSKSFDNTEKYSYVEDNIDIFNYYTDGGYIIPTVSDEYFRVTDSFTLLPSWIRDLCKIDNRRLVELDYTALHPNIAISLYGGSTEYLTHDLVSETTGIDKSMVKRQHLMFFNLQLSHMLNSKLIGFYQQYEPEMVKNIVNDKKTYGQTNITKKLFKMEVDIMTSVVKKLNSKNIYVLYIYDALCCHPKHQETVKEIMNETIIEFNVKTKVK